MDKNVKIGLLYQAKRTITYGLCETEMMNAQNAGYIRRYYRIIALLSIV